MAQLGGNLGYDPKIHDRKSIRLEGYDYAGEGSYFVTICTKGRDHSFGKIVKGEMMLSPMGQIVCECWLGLPNHFSNVTLDEFQIMPDHFHGIVVIWGNQCGEMVQRRDLINQIPGSIGVNQIPTESIQSNQIAADTGIDNNIPMGIDESHFGAAVDWPLMKNPNQTLGKIIRHFKAKATKKIHDAGLIDFGWQGKFYDHIIRGQEDLDRIRDYIRKNPSNWSTDEENLEERI